MGLILGRFRKKKSALEQLDKIDADIKSIEAFRLNTELAQKRIVGHFILVSAGIYILVAIVFYFYFFPALFYDQLFYITPLLLVPFIIWGVKRLLTWYYRRKISRNESKLSTLRTEKRKLLDHVMDTETYKIAKTILEKYAPEQVKKSPTSFEITPYKQQQQQQGTPGNIRARMVTGKVGITAPAPGILNNPPKTPAPLVGNIPPKTPINPQLMRTRALSTPHVQTGPPNTNNQLELVKQQPGMSPLPLPREILPRERSVLDKMVEYLVGDGPSNRFALICKNCQSHNGMALKEEFEYFAFRCCYCYHFNPARKLRPSAPKLMFDLQNTPNRRRYSSSTSSSEKNSEPDSEIEEKTDKDLNTQHHPDIDLHPEQGDHEVAAAASGSVSPVEAMEVEDINLVTPEKIANIENIEKSDEEKKDD